MQVNLAKYWYGKRRLHPLIFLWPFSLLFGFLTTLRRFLFRLRVLKTKRISVPVIVVGNITVGGTGKTPFVIWLSNYLKEKGYRPGIVSRGVGGRKHKKPHLVKSDDLPAEVGDEALLIVKHSNAPLMISINRAKAARALLKKSHCNIIISDDGLQHYRLGRDLEIAIVDGKRRFGNKTLLPTGPLREPLRRLKKVDMLIVNGSSENPNEFGMQLSAQFLLPLGQGEKILLSQFPHKKIHAFAGIGHPERFFDTLKQAGFIVIPHVFPDHYLYQAKDFLLADDFPIIMTEKDAVKCAAFAKGRIWYLPVSVKLEERAMDVLLEKLKRLEAYHDSEVDFKRGVYCSSRSSDRARFGKNESSQ